MCEFCQYTVSCKICGRKWKQYGDDLDSDCCGSCERQIKLDALKRLHISKKIKKVMLNLPMDKFLAAVA